MNLIYIHGLDSDANAIKALLLEDYCKKYHPDINVYRPDLNQPPQVVFDKLLKLVAALSKDSSVVLVGSSLGGYFATLVSNETGCSALLVNPSTQPHLTLQRFDSEMKADTLTSDFNKDKVIHTTSGGWEITKADLQWFANHQLLAVENPSQIAVMLKQGDELLDANLSAAFYGQQGAKIILQDGGDHRFSDFSEQLPLVLSEIQALVNKMPSDTV